MPKTSKNSSGKPPKRTRKKIVKIVRKKVIKRKKTRIRGQSSRDLRHALLLTTFLIAVSALIAIAALSIQQRRIKQDDTLSTPEIVIPEKTAEVPVPEAPNTAQEKSPVKKPAEQAISAAVITPQEKQQEKKSAEAPAPAAQKTPPENNLVEKITKTPVPATQKIPQEKPPSNNTVPKTTATTLPAQTQSQPEKTPITKIEPAVRANRPQTVQPQAPPELPKPPQHQGTLVFVIDDAGNNLQELEPFLRFPGPLTIAVLPGLPHSAEAARRIRAAGKEVFLHQPMEAIGGQNPGPGAIYAEMNTEAILAILNKNITEIGPISGMNNHQGSKITMNQQIMETVLGFCRENGIPFIDSRTTSETAVPAAARSLGLKIGERSIFIDNEQSRSSMNRSIEAGLSQASHRGSAIMIGHTWSPELAPLLTDLYQNLLTQGYTLSTASKLIGR